MTPALTSEACTLPSARTVDTHLARTSRKRGITGRDRLATALGAALPEG